VDAVDSSRSEPGPLFSPGGKSLLWKARTAGVFRRVLLVVVVVVSLPAVATAGVVGPASTGTVDGGEPATSSAAMDGAGVDPLAASGATSRVDAASTADETLTRTIELHLTPDDPGTIRAVVSYDVPESLTSLEVTLGTESTVVGTNGFERSGTQTYEWTESTTAPTLELSLEANQTSGGRRTDVAAASALGTDGGPTAGSASPRAETGYVFVDAGSWALTQVPRVGTRWRWTGAGDVTLAKETTVAGEGATGGEMAYFGPVERYEAEGRDERFTLVVPERAELNATPDSILASLLAASERLRVGARSDHVFVVAAPRDVEWGIAGLQYGEDDAWVLADAPVADADSVWLHEYVHTRQAFVTTESGEWTTEATADYYAALLAFEQGAISYDAFEAKLERGQRDRYDDDVLTFPRTWSGGANYLKGALAVGAIDLRLRESSNRTATFQRVFRALNAYNGSVSNGVFLDAVEATGDATVREYAASLSRTDRTAQTWSERTHGQYFGELPAVFEYRVLDEGVTASDVYGERALDADGEAIALAAGETLSVAVEVANVGWEAGEYATALRVDDAVVAERTGRLAADGTRTVTFERAFADPGTYQVAVGGRTFAVEVVDQPTPTVASLDAPASAAVGEDVQFTVTVENPAPVPGRVTLPVAVDDEVLQNETIEVPAASSATRTYSVTFDEPGAHTIRVGETSTVVAVTGDSTPTAESATTATGALPESIPGFGPVATLAALGVLAAVALVRTRS
jgi:hypothetical protein